MKTLEQLNQERRELIEKLDFSDTRPEIVKQIRENEAQTSNVRITQMLKDVNGTQARKRELARQAFECEQPTEDITTADGSLHKVKAKKYPKLASVQYLRMNFKDGRTTELNINGERFQMFRTKHEYNKDTQYTRPDTFADFLKLNSIQPADITREAFDTFAQKLDEANTELKKAIEKYDQTRQTIDCYMMQNIGLVSQNNTHVYIYEAKKRY